MIIQINPNLKDLPLIDYRELEDTQGSLKTLTKENYEKFRNTLLKQGLLCPFILWIDPLTGKKHLIDGHQRKRLFKIENVEPVMFPYLLVPGDNMQEAKKNLLAISSQYGTTTEQGYNEFIFDLPKEHT